MKVIFTYAIQYDIDIPEEDLSNLKEQGHGDLHRISGLFTDYAEKHDSRLAHCIEWCDDAEVIDIITEDNEEIYIG